MDNFFNHEVADWLYNSVSKMDDAEAEMFTRFCVYEIHKADLDNNRRTIDRHVQDVIASIEADLPEEHRDLVTKAWDADTPWEELYNKPQPRDKGGRWVKIGFGPAITFERSKPGKPSKTVDVTNALNRSGQMGTAFSDRWTESRKGDASTNDRTYRRIEAGARLLEHVPNKNVKAAAQLGQFAGQFGPEAEKVIGPAARRTAYRYRGTERMPDPELGKVRNEQLITERKRLYSDEELRRGAPPLTAEQKMAASEAAAANYLFTRLPKRSLASLQRASGKLPPSEGVIISPEGEIVTQAVGYNEDHYLPFNLKNLKGLQGGAYVRTRSTGGLTTEDIYTGLISGARSITVVSRSGVFTLDFEDDLRGGRRYSDKARQMIGRYAQTLDAVQSEKVSQRGLDPDERAEIREEVEAETKNMGLKAEEVEQMIRDREKEYSATPHLTTAELEQVNQQAREATESYEGVKSEGRERGVPVDPKKRFNYYRSEFMDAVLEEKKKRMYQLDADGYEAAMSALEEQFPYYIARTKVHKIPRGSEKDSGYVRPNYIRPKAVKAGFFDEEINGRGKFPASELHYQNYGVRHLREPGEGESKAAEKPKSPAAANAALNSQRAKVQATTQRRTAVQAAADSAVAFVSGNEKDYPVLGQYATHRDFGKLSEDEVNKLVVELDKMIPFLEKAEKGAYKTEAEELGRKMQNVKLYDDILTEAAPFDRSNENAPRVVPKTPSRFSDDPEHSFGQPEEVYDEALEKAVERAKLTEEVTSGTTDDQLRALEKKFGDLYAASRDALAKPGEAALIPPLSDAMIQAGFTNDQIRGAVERLNKGETSSLAGLTKEMEKKWLAVKEIRSIKHHSKGAIPRQAPAAPATPAVEGSTIKGELGSSAMSMVDGLLNASGTPKEEKIRLTDLKIALQSGDQESIEDALDELGPHHKALRDAVHEELRKRD